MLCRGEANGRDDWRGASNAQLNNISSMQGHGGRAE